MGIYDREYVRVGPRSSSGLGSLRFISVNSWIVVVNVAVFLISLLPIFRAQHEWVVGRAFADGATPEDQKNAQVVTSAPPSLVTAFRYPTYARPLVAPVVDTAGRQVLDAFGHPQARLVGQEWTIRLPLLEGLGHFSTTRGFFQLEIWRFVTFQFLHANGTHILFNMIGLWVFGGMVEQYLGSRRYLAFYLTCGIFGAISYMILNLLGTYAHLRLPGVLIDAPWTPLIGASAGVFGVILACAYIAPDAIVQLLFPPIPIKLKWFAYGYVVLAAWNLLRGGSNAGGDAAHMGGAIAGYFFIRNAHLLRDFFDFFGGGGRGATHPADSADVDRILSKVATQGLASLTPEEKRLLRQATERQRRA